MRVVLSASALFVAAVVGFAAEPAPDLADYKTVATAVRATPKEVKDPNRQPGHLGVNLDADASGLKIVGLEPESPAAKSGLKVGDQIATFAGQTVAEVNAFRTLLLNAKDGETVAIKVMRDGKPVDVTVKLAAPSRPMTTGPRAIIGIQMSDFANAVKIDRVTSGLPADKAGLKVGDVLTKIGTSEVSSQEKFVEVLAGFAPGDKVTFAVKREGKEMNVECELVAAPPERGGPRGPRGEPDEGTPSLSRWDDRKPRVFAKPIYRLAVVAVAFPDAKFNERITVAEWEKALFSKDAYKDKSVTGQTVFGSMNDYYLEMSCGKLSVAGKVFEAVEVSKKRAEYSANANRMTMFTEALDKVSARDGADALKDYDGVFFLYAGARVQTQRGGVFWPHKSNLQHQNKRWNYFICPEGGDHMASISTIAHEFGHMLGMPDLYAKPEDPGSEGLGVWCTMSTGHGRDGKPLHFSAWCKEQLGWVKPCLIDPSVKQKLILAPIENSAEECYKVPLRPDGSEYLLLENRSKRGFDRDLPGEGLLIWRVVDGRPALEESHGVAGPDGPQRFLGSVPYPSRSNVAFTPYTTPSSRPTKLGGLTVHITNIQKLPDGRIAFMIGYEYL